MTIARARITINAEESWPAEFDFSKELPNTADRITGTPVVSQRNIEGTARLTISQPVISSDGKIVSVRISTSDADAKWRLSCLAGSSNNDAFSTAMLVYGSA